MAFLLALGLVGCGIDIAPSSEVSSLRVFGVQKDRPYARPGEEVTLRMLWADGSKNVGRPIQRLWLAGCVNPPADLYAGCLASFGSLAADPTGATLPPGVAIGQDDTFTFKLPEDIVASHARSPDPSQPAFGTSFVFFAACAGTLGFSPTGRGGFPLECRGPDGSLLGADDFVAGFSQIFAYEELRNENPTVTGFELNGRAVTPDCIDAACLGLDTQAPDCDASPELCVAACEKDGDPKCTEIPFRAVVAPSSVEADGLAALRGRSLTEQIWANYYADRGSLTSAVKLVNDATTGFNDSNPTELLAPRVPGPLRLWAVVHDNRGGTAWARLTITVK